MPVSAAPELGDFLGQPQNRAFQEFHAYWLQKAAGKVMPSRADLDPLDIPQLLANIFLVDVVPGVPRRFRFRLVGTRIAELEGELTNRYLDDLIPGPAGAAIGRHYEDATEGLIRIRRETLRWHLQEREHVNYDVLLLPLSQDGAAVDMLFGLCIYRK